MVRLLLSQSSLTLLAHIESSLVLVDDKKIIMLVLTEVPENMRSVTSGPHHYARHRYPHAPALTDNDNDWLSGPFFQTLACTVKQSWALSHGAYHRLRDWPQWYRNSWPRQHDLRLLGFCRVAGHGDCHQPGEAKWSPMGRPGRRSWDLRKAVRRRLRESRRNQDLGSRWRHLKTGTPVCRSLLREAVCDEAAMFWSHSYNFSAAMTPSVAAASR